jgi:Type II secretion system (T2SS), protein M subtype b
MKRSLNQREKRLLALCIGTIFIVFNVLIFREFGIRRKAMLASLEDMEQRVAINNGLISDRPVWEKRLAWLDTHMPYTDSAGRSQGQLLEDLQNAALDSELKITSQTLLEPLALDHCNEVAVSLRVRGDQEKMMRLLLMLQAPDRFTAIKAFDLQLDTRSKEKTPQAECNLTVARWFNSEPPPGTQPAAEPAPAEPEPLSPLESPSGVEKALAAPEKI